MKQMFLFMALLGGAILARLLLPRKIGLAWVIDKNHHGSIDLNILVFWVLILALAISVLTVVVLRIRNSS